VRLSPNTRRNLKRILPFGCFWLVFGLVYAMLEKGLLGDLRYYPSTGNPYNFWNSIVLFIMILLVTGLMVGTFEVLYLSKLFIKKNLVQKIVFKALIYLVIIIAFLFFSGAITNAYEMQRSIFDPLILDSTVKFFSSFAFLSIVFYMAVTILISLFYSEVSDNLGQEVLMKFLTGKYHRPIQEQRIFMFLDMNFSTTIAEKIGHIRYFELLREYYADLSGPVILASGEIYQYVGDEMIVTWELKNGLLDKNCLKCFFLMKEAMEKQSAKFNEEFGVIPTFKAGIHCGTVTSGEIGEIKKNIIYTGDVLNTTSRIQGLCNSLAVDLLISDDLLVKLENTGPYNITSKGKQQLRGRDEEVVLYAVTE